MSTDSPIDYQEIKEWLNLDADESKVYLAEAEKEMERELQGDGT